jgi:tripartite-type tricarboxylate transporter receptor subunit TctC
MTGMKLNHIPYRGSGQATTDLLGGQVSLSIPGMAGMLGHQAGKLRALAVTGSKRAAVARRADGGRGRRSGLCRYVWLGLLAPKHAANVVDKLYQAVKGSLPTTRSALHGAGEHRASRIDARRIRNFLSRREGPVGKSHSRDRAKID